MYANMKNQVIYHYGVTLRLSMTKNLEKKERNRNSGTSSKLEEDDVDELLLKSMVTHAVYLTEYCGFELFTLALMIATTLHLLFQC